jgi:hypothetical protein
MNYYAQGGQAHGLKSLAQQLPKYGRYGDDMVAHISSDEARILKSMGGSGTINPTTGLPEFFKIGNIFKPVQQAAAAVNPFNPGSALNKGINQIPIVGDINKAANNLGTQIFQPLEKAFVQPASRGLASFDKLVGNTIPGGYGTIASIAGSAMGVPTPFLVGLGALNGSGVTRKGGSFNLQGALMGGAMAYGAAELGEYARGAAGGAGATGSASGDALANSGGAYIIPGETGDILVNSQGQLLNSSGQVLNPATQAASGAINASSTLANSAPYVPSQDVIAQQAFQDIEAGLNAGGGTANTAPSMFDRGLAAIKEAPGNAMDSITTGAKSIYNSAGNALDSATKLDTYTGALDRGLTNAGKTASGVQNLLGLGEGSQAAASQAARAAAASAGTMKPMMAAGAVAYGGMGLMALEEQRKYLEEAKAAQTITDTEYNNAMAEINRSTEDARRAVRESPFSTTPNRDVSIGDTYYGRTGTDENLYSRLTDESKLYAMGGSVDDEYGMDEARGLNQGNLQNGFMNMGSTPSYAAGGMPPRFLSGGGDGMSDDIKATINGNQEARLADGEFVVPADVVSHLGNGSSKAGAKQLYSMMDKVRTARTGRKSQGKQINPRKYLAA